MNFFIKPTLYQFCLLSVLFCLLGIGCETAQAQTRAEKLRDRYLDKSQDNNHVWIMAHRGVWDEKYPESSLEAFKQAVKLNYEIIELDVVFSKPFKYTKGGQCIAKDPATNEYPTLSGDDYVLGAREHRAIIFCHDQADKRLPDGIGLFEYDKSLNNTKASNKNKVYKAEDFVFLRDLVPYNAENKNAFCPFNNGDEKISPVILKLDGTQSDQHLIWYNPAVSSTHDDNKLMMDFVNAVKGNILINFDKLKADTDGKGMPSRDFEEIYDFLVKTELINQSILKTKGVKSIEEIENLFGNTLKENFNKKKHKGLMFTPTFTEYEFGENKTINPGGPYNNDPLEVAKFEKVKKYWKDINVTTSNRKLVGIRDPAMIAELKEALESSSNKSPTSTPSNKSNSNQPIIIAGAEVIYKKDLSGINNVNLADIFVTKLAQEVQKDGKRIVQFGTVPENKQGPWTGKSCKWTGDDPTAYNNFWSYLYDNKDYINPTPDNSILADVYVGDKPWEFRVYLNNLGYNMKPLFPNN